MRLSTTPLVLFAAVAFAASAHATSINFATPNSSNPAPGSYTPAGDDTSTSPVAFTQYTEYGFIINAVSGWDYNPNQGDPLPDLTGGHPVSNTSTLTISDGGLFSLSSLNLDVTGGTGNWFLYANGSSIAFDSGTISGASDGTYQTITSNQPNALVSSVTLTVTDSTNIVYLDNIDVTATPEPSSLLLLGTGLVGLGTLARRRFAR